MFEVLKQDCLNLSDRNHLLPYVGDVADVGDVSEVGDVTCLVRCPCFKDLALLLILKSYPWI